MSRAHPFGVSLVRIDFILIKEMELFWRAQALQDLRVIQEVRMRQQ